MPTYEYECSACGHISDVSHSMTAKRRVKCPECGGRTKKKIGAGAGIIFKGSGFYETDYRRKSNSTAEKKKEETTADAPSKDGGGGEKKPEKPKKDESS